MEDGRFGILPDGGPTVRLVGRAFDVLMALVEASGAVVSTDELSSRVRQGRIVDQNRQSGTIAALRISANRELIPIVADGLPVHQRDPRALRVRAGRPPPRRLRTSRAAAPANRPPGSVSELIREGAIGRHACRGKPIAIGECEILPTADELATQPRWTFFMAWAELVQNSKLVQPIQDLDTAVNVVTLGQMSEAV